jgi:spore maturation protein CgeB
MSRENPDAIRRTVPIPAALKRRLRSSRLVRTAWTALRARQVEDEYRRRRDYYDRIAEERDLVYSVARTTAEVRARLAARGYTPTRRAHGEIHTFAAIPIHRWHEHLLPDLRELGKLTHFDYTALGFRCEVFASPSGEATRRERARMNTMLVDAVRKVHAERPVDWIFLYGGAQDYSPAILRRLTDEIGVPLVNMTLDDKHGFSGRQVGDARTGAIDITRHTDLFWTSARVACAWHMVEGGRPLYLPEAFNSAAYGPMDVSRDIPVSFIGEAYGFRVGVVDAIRRAGIDVRTFGGGWGTRSVWRNEQVEIINRTAVNLGMGGVEYSETLTNLKCRDFEVPGTGGGVYVTAFNSDLAQHFVVGEEIVCYSHRDELIDLLRWYLARPEEADAIAQRARARALRDHRWIHRYEAVLRIIGVL